MTIAIFWNDLIENSSFSSLLAENMSLSYNEKIDWLFGNEDNKVRVHN
jgi:hypothetical protein